MGSKRNARAIAAITRKVNENNERLLKFVNNCGNVYLLAVQIANSICIESKKKNIIKSETDAPSGKHSACIVSKVCTPDKNNS